MGGNLSTNIAVNQIAGHCASAHWLVAVMHYLTTLNTCFVFVAVSSKTCWIDRDSIGELLGPPDVLEAYVCEASMPRIIWEFRWLWDLQRHWTGRFERVDVDIVDCPEAR